MREIKTKYFNLYITLTDIAKNFWVIVCCFVIGFVGSFSYNSFFRKNKYTSTMTVSINLSGYANNSTSNSLSRTISIAEILESVFKSSALKTIVEKELGYSITSDITAEQMTETNLINVSVTDTTPVKAYSTLTAIYKNYSKVTDYVFSNVIISVVENPDVPSSPSNSVGGISSSLKIGALFGLLSVLLIVVLSYFRDTLKNTDDVEELLDARLFGTVYHERHYDKEIKNGNGKLIISNPLIDYSFTESYRKMAIKLESLQRTKHIKTVMVTSIAENEGKSTNTVNLAAALAHAGNKVVIIDADMKKPSVFRFFSVSRNDTKEKTNKSIGNVINGSVLLEDAIRYDKETGVNVICGSRHFRDTSDMLGSDRFKKTLERLKEMFDFIIIDTPPSGLAVDAEVLSDVVDAAVCVVRQDTTTVTDINDYLDVLNRNNSYVAGVILNDVHVISRKRLFDDFGGSGYFDYNNF